MRSNEISPTFMITFLSVLTASSCSTCFAVSSFEVPRTLVLIPPQDLRVVSAISAASIAEVIFALRISLSAASPTYLLMLKLASSVGTLSDSRPELALPMVPMVSLLGRWAERQRGSGCSEDSINGVD